MEVARTLKRRAPQICEGVSGHRFRVALVAMTPEPELTNVNESVTRLELFIPFDNIPTMDEDSSH